MTDDIVERIRALRYVHVPVASQLFEEAVAEIERLRNGALASRETVHLTDAEREAIGRASLVCDGTGLERSAATLRGLLERLS